MYARKIDEAEHEIPRYWAPPCRTIVAAGIGGCPPPADCHPPGAAPQPLERASRFIRNGTDSFATGGGGGTQERGDKIGENENRVAYGAPHCDSTVGILLDLQACRMAESGFEAKGQDEAGNASRP